MSNWDAGYTSEITYTYGYYSELNPKYVDLALLLSGIEPPEIKAACELGYGQGISINIHAASTSTEWYGTDFIPSQALFAQHLASKSNSNIHLFDDSFEEFCIRDDLPKFDFIALHGIWSWISDENRQNIISLIKHKLNLGGIVYISYNTLPGWSSFEPMRTLLTEHANNFGSRSTSVQDKVSNALAFGEKLFENKSRYTSITTGARERFDEMKKQGINYLAHEYFNEDWEPMYFKDLLNWLTNTKLEFAATANYLDFEDTINFTPEQQEFINSISDKNFRETVKDFMINRQFRKDYWIKGKRQLTASRQIELIRKQEIILIQPAKNVDLKVKGALGEATLVDKVYRPILDKISDHKIYQIGSLIDELGDKIKQEQIIKAIALLFGKGTVAPARSNVTTTEKQQTVLLNKELVNLAKTNNDINHMASPIVSGAIAISRFQKLFLLATTQKCNTPKDAANFVWNILSKQGQKIMKDQQVLSTPEENVTELTRQAEEFFETVLPVMKQLEVTI